MNELLITIFKSELMKQCEFCLYSFSQIKIYIEEKNSTLIFYYLQSFLVAAGNISKIFWSKKFKERSKKLRELFEIDDNAIIKPRKFRDHFEHFDERIETWYETSRHHNFVDSNIGPLNAIRGIDNNDFLRNFDESTFTLTYRGDTYEIKFIFEYIKTLYDKIIKSTI